MNEVIQNLESRIQQLILQCEQLKEINIELRQSQSQLARDNESLTIKHKHVMTQIADLVSLLKSIETSQ